MALDLKKHWRFPPVIVDTRLGPDIFLVSRKTNRVMMLGLTVPLDDVIEVIARKNRSMHDLCKNAKRRHGKTASIVPVGVRCRGLQTSLLGR